MSNEKFSEPMCCFIIIAITTTAIVIVDLIARAFFYEQTRYFVPYLPLLIGSITLATMGIKRKYRDKKEVAAAQSNTTGVRRVRVTGPIK